VSQGVDALHALWERGLRVPADASLVAHADMPLAGYLVPPLTAVQMPLAELGAAGVAALVEHVQTGATRDVVVAAEPALIVHASTAPPPRARALKASQAHGRFRPPVMGNRFTRGGE
jgi:DNA-binding LacI/PurR family transcriptional regulator